MAALRFRCAGSTDESPAMTDIGSNFREGPGRTSAPSGESSTATGAGSEAPRLPADAMVIVPVRNTVLFPTVVMPLAVGRPRSIAAVQHAVRAQAPIGVLLQRDPETADPGSADLHEVGTIGTILRYVTAQDGGHHLICRGEQRFRIIEFLEGYPFLAARVERVAEPETTGAEVEARHMQLKERALEALKLIPNAPDELKETVRAVDSPSLLADL